MVISSFEICHSIFYTRNEPKYCKCRSAHRIYYQGVILVDITIYFMVKISVSLCLIQEKRHEDGGSGSTGPHIANAGTRWKRVISFTFKPFHPWGNSHQWADALANWINHCRKSNSGHPACGLVIILISPEPYGLGMRHRSGTFYIKQKNEMSGSNERISSSKSQKGAMPKKFCVALFRCFIVSLSFVFGADADRRCLHIHSPNFRAPPNLFAPIPFLVPSP
jgi:hypothetical protein